AATLHTVLQQTSTYFKVWESKAAVSLVSELNKLRSARSPKTTLANALSFQINAPPENSKTPLPPDPAFYSRRPYTPHYNRHQSISD
ncbi:hypothetical protein WBG78_07465, partial [Chryseolinea sp. T2]|uniref:hypothetical protein n=1 Tax=Chryseolinea sp. T2 TaxID=3129255 RepID=UPI00307710C4